MRTLKRQSEGPRHGPQQFAPYAFAYVANRVEVAETLKEN